MDSGLALGFVPDAAKLEHSPVGSIHGRAAVASWFETHGVAVLLTTRISDLILRSIAKRCVSKDEATERKMR
jgi:hypothetical protein